MKRYKNIDLDYGVNTELMEAYSAMLAEESAGYYDDDEQEMVAYSEEVYEVDEAGVVESNEAAAVETEGIASEIFEFEEE